MEQFRDGERGSPLRGRCTHNQRIERLWGDIWHVVSNVYHYLFTFLEMEQIIDINNEVYLWALHFVFLPRVNRDLAVFASQWNRHGLRTDQRQSPLQLFVSGSLAMQRANLTAVRDLFAPNSTISSQATTSAPPTTTSAPPTTTSAPPTTTSAPPTTTSAPPTTTSAPPTTTSAPPTTTSAPPTTTTSAPPTTTSAPPTTTSAPPTTGTAALYWSEWVIVPQIQFTISNTQMELLRTIIPLEGPLRQPGSCLSTEGYGSCIFSATRSYSNLTYYILPYWDEGLDAISSAPLVYFYNTIIHFIILTFPLFHTLYDLVSLKVR
ncbi:UV excision repair protein RAD23 homolog [Oncorhynchus clarkii lewisi]|uniref:UV excision repair protein RAD23 homolog n=1 Tax=Oncorhynchus clarkii lewisi TaxID=490388 RepID=UPI0039B8E645